MLKDLQIMSIRLFIWGFLLLLGILFWLNQNPLELTSEDSEDKGDVLHRLSETDVLLVVSYDAIEDSTEKNTFDETDWSVAWSNTLSQEVGTFSITDSEALLNLDLSSYRVIIITRSTSDRDDWALPLKSFAESGGVLVLEMPKGKLRTTFSADGKGGSRKAINISQIANIPEKLEKILLEAPLHTFLVGSTGPLDGAITHLTMDGVPVIYSKTVHMGRAITVDFNYGLLLTALQQGTPEPDFSVQNRYPEVLSDPLESNDLVMDEFLLDNSVPYADILEKILIHHIIGGEVPLPLLWQIPAGHQGALLMTHDEEAMGDASSWMASYEKKHKMVSTYFIMAGDNLKMGTLSKMRAGGTGLGIMWNRPFSDQGIWEHYGFWKFQPFRRARNLKQQLKAISDVFPPDYPILANRNHYLLWSDHYTSTFRNLTDQNLRIDSTYGPDVACKGYLFGTGLPFTPLDQNGLPFPLLELPFLASENLGDADQAFLETLFKESKKSYHQTITLSFHPNAYAFAPSVSLYQLWTSSYSLAQKYDHVSMTVSDLYRFYKDRNNSQLISGYRPTTSERGKKGWLLTVEVRIDNPKIWLAVPKKFMDKNFSKAKRGMFEPGGESEMQKLKPKETHILDKDYLLLPLSKGDNQINLTYF